MTPIIDMYAGPGGWSEGLRMLGLSDVGIEWDRDACLTRAAAGHRTVRADLASYPVPTQLRGKCALIASPPCPTFSAAGTGEGRAEIPRLVAQCHAGDWSTDGLDDRTLHVLTVGRWLDELRPSWVALEQVPDVLPVWRALAHLLRSWGYSVWTGVLCAADYGVPQTRRRAVLMASLERTVTAPVPTHAETPGMFGEAPWVSMADALGWGMTERPYLTVASGHQDAALVGGSGARKTLYATRDLGAWVFGRPATTVCGDPRLGNPGHRDREGGEPQFDSDAIRLTIDEALTLQSFCPDYPVAGNSGSRFKQVGNAVPPLLAMHVASELAHVAKAAA